MFYRKLGIFYCFPTPLALERWHPRKPAGSPVKL